MFFLWAGIISFSQVYVGVHYPFDVIVGGLIGFFIGSMSYWIMKSLAKLNIINQSKLSV